MTIERVIQGALHFRRNVLPSLTTLFRSLAHDQSPTVLLVACADSRIVPSRIVSADPGEVFEVRTVGNLVAPATAGGVSSGDVSEAAAIEYAVGVLEVSDIVVLGHSSCGAMNAILTGADHSKSAPNLQSWLCHGHAALARQSQLSAAAASLAPGDRLSQANVLVQIDHVATYPLVQERLASGALSLHGAFLDVGSGDLSLYDEATRSFRVLDEVEAQRQLESLAQR